MRSVGGCRRIPRCAVGCRGIRTQERTVHEKLHLRDSCGIGCVRGNRNGCTYGCTIRRTRDAHLRTGVIHGHFDGCRSTRIARRIYRRCVPQPDRLGRNAYCPEGRYPDGRPPRCYSTSAAAEPPRLLSTVTFPGLSTTPPNLPRYFPPPLSVRVPISICPSVT